MEDGPCGFLTATKSPREIAHTLDRILADGKGLARRGADALTHVRTYGEDVFLQRIRDLYDAVAHTSE